MRVLLVEDQLLFRQAIASLLGGYPGIEVVGEAGSVREAIGAFRRLCPDVVLMDFSLPDGTGLEATRAILAETPQARIVFLTVSIEDQRLFAAIRAGAKGYLHKNVAAPDLVRYLREAAEGALALPPDASKQILDEFARSVPRQTVDGTSQTLTHRELEVLRELATGASNSEIARRLVITESTVKNHIHSLLGKLHLRNRNEAARFATIYWP